MNHSEKILVLDGDLIPCLSIARSLTRTGLLVDIASHVEKPLSGYSRHASNVFRYPNPLTDEMAFLEWVQATLESKVYRLIIPVTERTVIPLRKLVGHADFEQLAIAPDEALSAVLDKSRTLEIARTLGIPAPRSLLVESADQIEASIASMTLPCVVKPSRSIGEGKMGRQQLSVAYAFTHEELVSRLEHFLNYGSVLLQEYVFGSGVGIELIADHGEVKYSFQHLRLHEVPLTGGGSSLRKSVPVEPELLDASRKLMFALKWHGVAMVEFKWNPEDRSFSLMEINGRFWGSLPLAIAAGADFPVMLHELLTTKCIHPRPAARHNIYCRKLSSEFDWLELVLRREGPRELVRFPSKGRIFSDAMLIFSPRHYFDVQRLSDPVPGFVDIGRTVQGQARRIARLIQSRRTRAVQRKAWSSGEVGKRLSKAEQILFVCYGNINRSALAERYFQMLKPARKIRSVSAGFHFEEGRPADPVMVDVAAQAGVDMRAWSSRRLSDSMVSASDVVFVMELQHLARLCEEYPEAADKAYLLKAGMLDARDGPEIADPYGRKREVYANCLRQVTSSVDHLFRFI